MQSRISAIPFVASGFLLLVVNLPVFGQELPTPVAVGDPAPTLAATKPASEGHNPYAPGTTPLVVKNPCPISTTHSYSDTACEIVVYRDKPGSPQPITVPKDTRIQIIVKRRPPAESIGFAQTTDALPPMDFGMALAKSFLPVLTGIQVKAFEETKNTSLEGRLADAQAQLNVISDELSCFKAAKGFVSSTGEEPPPDPCGAKFLNDGSQADNAAANQLKAKIIADSGPKKLIKLPVEEVRALDAAVGVSFQSCAKEVRGSDEANACIADAAAIQKLQLGYDDALTKLQAKQAMVVAARTALMAAPDAGDFYDVVAPSPDRKATIKITAKDVISGTSVDVATVIVSWRSTNFSISTGMLVSSLRNKTFANTPVIVNGSPVLDSTGKTITQVTESDTVPSFVTPLVFANYEMPFFYSRNGKFGTLLSGGLGSNLTAKTADYAAGISFRYRDLLFSPVVHVGRVTELTNGVYVGQRLGSSPPTLPTAMRFTPKAAFAITYRIPIP